MKSRHPLVGPSLGLVAGIALGVQGVPFHPAAYAGFLLALSPALAPGAFLSVGWLAARPAVAAKPEPPRDADV